MKEKRSYFIVTILLLTLPTIITSFKYLSKKVSLYELVPREIYEVNLEFDMTKVPPNSYVKYYRFKVRG